MSSTRRRHRAFSFGRDAHFTACHATKGDDHETTDDRNRRSVAALGRIVRRSGRRTRWPAELLARALARTRVQSRPTRRAPALPAAAPALRAATALRTLPAAACRARLSRLLRLGASLPGAATLALPRTAVRPSILALALARCVPGSGAGTLSGARSLCPGNSTRVCRSIGPAAMLRVALSPSIRA